MEPMNFNKSSKNTIGTIFLILGVCFFIPGILITVLLKSAAFIVFIILGLVFGIIGAVFRGKAKAEEKQKADLIAGGYSSEAEIIDIEINYSTTINNQHPCTLVARYFGEDGTAYLYRSNQLMQNPGPYLTKNFVRVYYNPNDANDYYVDVESAIGKVVEL